MARRITRECDDKAAGIRFHISSARLSMSKISFVAFQRFLDEMERSMYLCPECGWRGRGRELVPMEEDGNGAYAWGPDAETWYACPKCETEIGVETPVMRPTD
ncbi:MULTISPECIES: hypothetical protein [Methylococcus]|uniref:Rubredoxin n=1 Tax=Methylococcus capsulatus TaxID=414 RepID=A0ABZ2F4Z0_METCP|nr:MULTISPECIES: hypothetical protein [Methylococcus]MDF9391820.1 hypothetical protein [Methylococcus capsulatus]